MNNGEIIKIESNMGLVKEYEVVKSFSESAIKAVNVKSGNEYRFHVLANGRVEALNKAGRIYHFGYVA